MKISSELPDHAAIVECVLEGFVRANQLLVESGVIPPDPMDVPGVRYQLEGPGEEDWKLGHNVVRDGWGDCEDVACWRAGGLRATGEDPEARAIVAQTGEHKLHAVVMRGDGSISDPSRELYERQHADHR